jgi:hypothetical protein
MIWHLTHAGGQTGGEIQAEESAFGRFLSVASRTGRLRSLTALKKKGDRKKRGRFCFLRNKSVPFSFLYVTIFYDAVVLHFRTSELKGRL